MLTVCSICSSSHAPLAQTPRKELSQERPCQLRLVLWTLHLHTGLNVLAFVYFQICNHTPAIQHQSQKSRSAEDDMRP